MKYMEKGGFQNNPHMRLTLGFSLLFFFGLWITNFMMYFSKMSLTPQSVVDYYLCSEINFTMARTYQSMLEVTHFHLPIMAIVILMLTHLVIFAPLSNKMKTIMIIIPFMSAFLGESAGWLVRFVNPHFAVLKIACFVIFQTSLAILMISLGAYLSFPSKRKRKS